MREDANASQLITLPDEFVRLMWHASGTASEEECSDLEAAMTSLSDG